MITKPHQCCTCSNIMFISTNALLPCCNFTFTGNLFLSFFLLPSQIVAGPVPNPLFVYFFSQLKMKPNTPQNKANTPTHTLHNNKSPIDSSALYGVGVGGSTKHSGNSNMQEQRTAHSAKSNRKPQHIQVKQTQNHSTHKSNKHKTTAHTSQTNTKLQHTQVKQTQNHSTHKSNKHKTTAHTSQTNTKLQHTQVKQT